MSKAKEIIRSFTTPVSEGKLGTYFQQLKSQLEDKTNELKEFEDRIQDLKSYLMSSKFHNDPYVNIKDVLRRLEKF